MDLLKDLKNIRRRLQSAQMILDIVDLPEETYNKQRDLHTKLYQQAIDSFSYIYQCKKSISHRLLMTPDSQVNATPDYLCLTSTAHTSFNLPNIDLDFYPIPTKREVHNSSFH